MTPFPSGAALLLALLGMTPAPEGQGGFDLVRGLLPFVLIFGIFYFLVFAPMRKKQRLHAQMLEGLRAGDKVITNGGIMGTVVGVTDDVVQLRIADKVKIDVSRNAVAAKQQPEG